MEEEEWGGKGKTRLAWAKQDFFLSFECYVPRPAKQLAFRDYAISSYKSFPHTLLQTRNPFKSIEFEGRAPPSANTG